MTADQESRARDVRAAVASARLEGVVITPNAMEIFDAYVAGTVDADELARPPGPGHDPLWRESGLPIE